MKFCFNNESCVNAIYKITNITNGRIYIGSTKNIKTRWSNHARALSNNRHSNKFLQNDFNKHGSDMFIFSVLENIENKEERFKKETIFISEIFRNGFCYNLTKTAHIAGGKPRNNIEETKKKRSEFFKKLWENPEHKKLMSKKSKEKFQNTNFVKSFRIAASEAASRTFKLKSPQGEIITVVNLKTFAKENNLKYIPLWKAVTKKQKEYKGWQSAI